MCQIRNQKNIDSSKKYQSLTAKPWNTYSDADKIAYVTEPTEYDAMGSEYDVLVKDKFNSGNMNDKINIVNSLRNWLIGRSDLPFLDPEMVQRWQNKPTLWRNLKKKVFHLMKELEQKLALLKKNQ